MSSQPKISIGAIVKLKSGSPEMTVNSFDEVGGYYK